MQSQEVSVTTGFEDISVYAKGRKHERRGRAGTSLEEFECNLRSVGHAKARFLVSGTVSKSPFDTVAAV